MRYRFLIMLIIIFFGLIYSINGEHNFKQIDQWNFDALIYGHVFNAIVDKDNDLIIMFFRNGIHLVNKNKVDNVAKYGQGPGEIQSWCSLCAYRENIADIELQRKIQIFNKENGKYIWNRNLWRKEEACMQKIMSSLFIDGKWFFAGFVSEFNESNDKAIPFLRVYLENGNFLKQPIRIITKKSRRYNLMSYYLAYNKDYIFFLSEDNPIVFLLSRKELELKQEVSLPVPNFYKKMPDDFYSWEIPKKSNFILEFQKWKTSYSRITNAVVVKDFLVIQIRTCKPDTKKFALLFFSIKDFKLVQTIFTDDFLLTVSNGKYYFFKNGNPSLDEEAERFIISIFSFGKE